MSAVLQPRSRYKEVAPSLDFPAAGLPHTRLLRNEICSYSSCR